MKKDTSADQAKAWALQFYVPFMCSDLPLADESKIGVEFT